MKRYLIFALSFFIFLQPACKKSWDVLSPDEKIILTRIQAHWETWMPQKKKEGVAPLINFEELYANLDQESQMFLDRIRAINPKKSFDFQGDRFGLNHEGIKFHRIDGQTYIKNGNAVTVDAQYLPENVFAAYEKMVNAMQKDIGKKLLVDSGYRSPAYQLYTYLYYLPKHKFSLVETGHWVALPGYSEHGAPSQQAIDFISQEGENGDDNPENFARLPEYKWLLVNGKNFGFVLSYPQGQKGVQFEPWHWSYRKT